MVDLIQSKEDGTRHAMKTGGDDIEMHEINRLKQIHGFPGVIQIHGWFLCGLGLCIVTEWAPYGTLRECLLDPKDKKVVAKMEKWMDADVTDGKLKLVYRQIDAALRYLHEHGVSHGDLHCKNVVFVRPDLLKLIDFHDLYEDSISDDVALSDIIAHYILEREEADKLLGSKRPRREDEVRYLIDAIRGGTDEDVVGAVRSWALYGDVEHLNIQPRDVPPRDEWTGWSANEADLEFEENEWFL